ncbi:MAG: hypothetical protein K6E29_07560 [Cyanobacteria bacterium RUI128]|nr:hypothetical protein [Cyanobacteria bacterium RUI128]
MKVNLLGNFYRSKTLKKGLEFAADKGALFAAGTSLALSTVARPIAIYATPKTDKENRKVACAKSIASSAVGFGLMLVASLPIANSIKKISNNPDKYLEKKTIGVLKESGKALPASKGYQFATQLFKLGVGAAAAIPKSIITCALIPPIIGLLSSSTPKKDTIRIKPVTNNNTDKNKDGAISFKGKLPKEPLTKGISKIINTDAVQNITNKYMDTNYPMHISALTDTLATGAFIARTKKSSRIKEERKNTLMLNAGISTGLSIGVSYVIDKALKKPTEKFIDNFRKANKNSPKLEKYVEGIRIAKPTLILGAVYYCAIPFVSTFLAEKFGDNKDKKKRI